jgi:AbrB family transcriptional regulator, transcriptional pleiotropic regulator of transition state genes
MGDIVRRLDELGRLVIPMELRRRLSWSTRQPLAVRVENDEVILSRYEQACALCGDSEAELTEVGRASVCQACRQAVARIDTESETTHRIRTMTGPGID